MEPIQQLTLLVNEDIDRMHIRLEHHMHGWDLWLYHCHLGGRFGDCEAVLYEALALGEAIDVIEATALLKGHADSRHAGYTTDLDAIAQFNLP